MHDKSQPPPRPGDIEVVPEVIADLRARSEMGRAKYGTTLRAMNGRSALTDAYQEALDMACYMKQRLIEEDDVPALKARIEELEALLQKAMDCDSGHPRGPLAVIDVIADQDPELAESIREELGND